MLPGPRRLKRATDFGNAVRRGARSATATVVVHMWRSTTQNPPVNTRVGFVVSKKVGNAVVRNRVKRRLRHLTIELNCPDSADVVVRALPGAAQHPQRLAADLQDAWRAAQGKVNWTC